MHAQRPNPPQKRRRPALACEQCRYRKVRCDRASPCSTCVRTRNPDCTYAPAPPALSARVRETVPSRSAAVVSASILLEPSPSLGITTLGVPEHVVAPSPAYSAALWSGLAQADSPSVSAPPSLISSATAVESLERKVKQLEKQLQSALSRQRSPSATWSLRKESHLPGESPESPTGARDVDKTFVPLPIRGTLSKTRFFGQSHWASGANLIPSKVT